MPEVFKMKKSLNLPVILFVTSLTGLPFVSYYSLNEMQKEYALTNAQTFTKTIAGIRDYYATNVVKKVLDHPNGVTVRADYEGIPGAIPIPAKLSIDVSNKLNKYGNSNFKWNFVSEYPFRDRPKLDDFQLKALRTFEKGEVKEYWDVVKGEDNKNDLRYAVPIIMQKSCVQCHNYLPTAKKRDWKEGDIRGVQDVSIHVHATTDSPYLYWFGGYLAFFIASVGWLLIANRRTNNALISANQELIYSKNVQEKQNQELESSLEQLKKLYRVIEEAPFGITFADASQENLPLVFANKHFYEMTGFNEQEAIGDTCKFLLGENVDQKIKEEINLAIREKSSFNGEILSTKKDGTPIWINLMMFPIFNDKEELIAYAGCQTDLTKLKHFQEEQQNLMSELIESQKKQSIGLTVAGIAHDLNTPIGVANTAVSHLENSINKFIDKIPESEKANYEKVIASLIKTCTLISSNLQKAAQLVKSFKQTTESSTRGENVTIDLDGFLNTLATSVSPVLKKSNCKININCSAMKIYTEPGALGQILTNLIVNSTVHAFDGIDSPQINIDVTEEAENIRIMYKDNGKGMSQEVIDKAFTPFFTTKRDFGGTGLGLFSSKRIAKEVFGGDLTLESKDGESCIFHLLMKKNLSVKIKG